MSDNLMRFLCPCGSRLRSPAGSEGRKVACKKCGKSLRIPKVPAGESLPTASIWTETHRPTHAATTAPAMTTEPPKSGISWQTASLFAGVGLVIVVGIVVPLVFIIPNLKNEETKKFDPPATIAQVAPKPAVIVPPQPPEPPGPIPQPNLPVEVVTPKKIVEPEPTPMAPKETGSERPITPPKSDPPLAKTDPGITRAALEFVEDKMFVRVPTEVAKVIEAVIPYQVRRIKVEQKAPRKMQLAVSPAGSDNMAEVLRKLSIPFDDYANAFGKDVSFERLQNYDVIFLNCGGQFSTPEDLRKYVANGGTLYASDLQFENVKAMFSGKPGAPIKNFIPPQNANTGFSGIVQKLQARVTDPSLRGYLGVDSISLNFNAPSWQAAVLNMPKQTKYLEGEPINDMNGAFAGGGLDPFGGLPPGADMPAMQETNGILRRTDTVDAKTKKPYKAFPITMKANLPYRIEVTSGEFDPVLRLNDLAGKTIAEASAEQDGAAVVTYTPKKSGAFRLIVTTKDKVGPFQMVSEMTGDPLDMPAPQPKGKGAKTLPLLVKFPYEKGTVIFTSFHNSTQALNGLEKKLLDYLVFSTLTAKTDNRVTDVMEGVGFELQSRQAAQLSTGGDSPTYEVEHQGGALQLAVGFENAGAKMRITVTPPSGQKIVQEETTTFLLEIPNAPRGAWRYSLTSVESPFPNFPVVLGVAKGK
ncbi:MAG: hypothetical protein U0744_16055 [Gemmataceae bacterium]